MITHAVVSSTGSDAGIKAAVGVARSLMSAGVNSVCFTGWGRPITVSFGRTVVRTAPNAEWLANFANSADEVLTVDSSSLPPEDVDADFIASMSGKTGPMKAVSDGRSSYVLDRDLFQDAVKSGESGIDEAIRRMGAEVKVVGTPVVDPVPDMKRPAVQRKATFLKREVQETAAVKAEDARPEESLSNKPILPVCFITHNRTAVACHCLDALCKRLKYNGRIYFCICDDRSVKGHIKALEHILEMNRIEEYSVLRTSRGSWGLGASMNNGLAVSFALSDVVLTTEDDFLLCADLDITGMVDTIVSNSVAGIRLAHVPGASWKYTVTRTRPCGINGYIKVVGGDSPDINRRHVFNNQVMLRHRRVYDSIGMYLCNADTDTVEEDMVRKYNEKYNSGNSNDMQVLYPSYLRLDTLNNGLFGHIGKSQTGHPPCFSISGYESLNTDKSDAEARSLKDIRTPRSASENIFVVNDLQYPGRLGNLMMLVAMTHIYASRRGIPAANVFFKRSVNTRDGWINERGEKGKTLTDYLSKNCDVLVPVWRNMLDDDSFNRVARTPGAVVFKENVINNTVIREFTRYIRGDSTGILSSLFYDESTFMRHINDFPEYYSTESVALHVRLTDFKFLKTASRNPKVDADRIIRQCTGKTVVVFSDDIDWCKENLNPPVGGRIVFHDKPGAPCDDLILMSCFKTVLQTEEISTYSLIAKLLSEDLQKSERMYWI